MPVVLGNLNCTQEQPSPISVLEPSFEEDDNLTPESFGKNDSPTSISYILRYVSFSPTG